MEVLASAPTPQVAQDVSLLNSRIEEQVLAIDDLYGRRVAVFRACRSKLEGSWQRPPPGIQRGDGGHVTYVEPQRSPHPAREGLGRARRILEREGGGSATIDPVVLTQDLTDLLGTKVPEKWRAVASFFGGPDEVSFVQGPGGVDVNVTRNFPVIPPSIRGGLSDLGSTFGVGGVEQASGPQTAGVRLSVRDGKVAASVTAWPSVAGRLGLDSAKAAKELENALRALNKELDRRGLQVTGISVEGGKLQITSAPT